MGTVEDVERKKELSIGELSDAASVTARTIRYYVAEGLLPPPEKGGRGATYDEEHLARLQLIKRLKEEYLPLQEIAALMRGLDRQAVIDLLEHKQPRARTSATAHVQELLEASRGSGSERLRLRAEARSTLENDTPRGARWRRLVVDDGVELHVREDRLGGSSRDRARRLFHFARGLFVTR